MNAGKSFINRLESSGLLTATSHIVVRSVPGHCHLTGHARCAIIMGLAGTVRRCYIDEIPHLSV
ncbi:hypothetical protein ACNKHU_19200 [Shigella flexneri]